MRPAIGTIRRSPYLTSGLAVAFGQADQGVDEVDVRGLPCRVPESILHTAGPFRGCVIRRIDQHEGVNELGKGSGMFVQWARPFGSTVGDSVAAKFARVSLNEGGW